MRRPDLGDLGEAAVTAHPIEKYSNVSPFASASSREMMVPSVAEIVKGICLVLNLVGVRTPARQHDSSHGSIVLHPSEEKESGSSALFTDREMCGNSAW